MDNDGTAARVSPPDGDTWIHIPSELKSRRQWVLWRLEKLAKPTKDGKTHTKVPYNARIDFSTGEVHKALANQPRSWSVFGAAVAALQRGNFTGLGYEITSPHTGIDLDGCRDPMTGAIAPWALVEVRRFNSYTEISPSGKGLHIWIRGKIRPEFLSPGQQGRKIGSYEAYSGKHFLTMTGQQLGETPATIEERQEELDAFCAEHFAPKSRNKPERTSRRPALTLSDDDLVRKACGSNTRFAALWSGDTSGYGDDESRADAALIGHLDFWTGGDTARIERLMRASGLYREKFDRPDYLARSIAAWQRDHPDAAHYGDQRAQSQAAHTAQAAQVAPVIDFPRRQPLQTGGENITPISRGQDSHIPEEPKAPAQPEHLTDLGNARRFVRMWGDRARYVSAWDRWYIWDSTRWRHDTTDEAVRMAKDTVRNIYNEVADVADDTLRRDLAKWAVRSESESRIRAMLNLAHSEPEVAIGTDVFDRSAWLLNCRNGTLDLHTGELRKHQQCDLITKRAETDYDETADCPTWHAFLDKIFAGNRELIAYVQRAVGYALTGDTSEQCFFILHGSGSNGKSTFLDVLARILSDYAMTTPTDTLMEKRGQTIPSDVARLVGARFVTAAEVGEGRRLDEEFIKRATGSDPLSARFMHKDWFDFYPVFKLFLAVNHKPVIRGTDKGIWRRPHLWPFEVTIPEDQQDKQLTSKLLAESSGILAWAVQGCLAWQHEGLNPPEIVRAAVEAYRTEMDRFAGFIEDCCVLKPTAIVTSKLLLERYHEWCQENGEVELSGKKLVSYLSDKLGCKPCRDARANRAWVGIGLCSQTYP